ncbi:MAG: hypothetical protein PUJ51_14435 [Clostridiales bacterium]|uniref:hypothetical protein n=1 Tax=Terrisporobacter sp. TaxID=1965305 RepID=UPI002A50B3A9|nr:hypothetical protein [Terrisporobacter sp.]MDD7755683.1 hypothetical protein [Clostridiales bacterium]MDY4135192.1 hypothetical protein [Terrisporobacter sp.]
MSKKYKLTDETINLNGATLYRIEALKDFGEIKKGDKGGFIESENNLAHEGDAWVSDNAHVYGDACVFDNARVYNNAFVSGYAQVYGNAFVYGNAWLYDNTRVCDYAWVADNARVYGDANVCDDSSVFGSACVYGNARVCRDALVRGYACVCGDAEISNKSDYIVFQNWWSSGRYFTWTRSNNMWSVGCFYGTGEELIKKAYKDSELSGREYERIVKYVEEIRKDNGK